MTPTEKKYQKHIGKLYWCAERIYNHERQDYEPYYSLIMIGNCKRKYGASGKYAYDVHVLNTRSDNHRKEYRIDCSYFVQLFGSINKWGQGYFAATTGEIEKDVDQIKKAG